LDENMFEVQEAPNAGGKFPIVNPEDCPEAEPNPEFDPTTCELLPKPELPPNMEEYAGGSPGGGGGFENIGKVEGAADEAEKVEGEADEAEKIVGLVVDGREKGLLKGAVDPMESPPVGFVALAAFLAPERWTVKVTPSLKLRDAPSARAASKIASDSNHTVPKCLPGHCFMPQASYGRKRRVRIESHMKNYYEDLNKPGWEIMLSQLRY
jgi:hypothetical protein